MNNYLLQNAIDAWRFNAPKNIAVQFNNDHITHEELYTASNKLSRALKSVGISRQDRVAICLKRSIKYIVSILGSLKSDAIYVPIDPKSPPNRSATILNDCKPKAIICEAETLDIVSQSLGKNHPTVILLNHKANLNKYIGNGSFIFQDDIEIQMDEAPEYKNIDMDSAYILYTSGSTGTPKGVVISHLNILNYVSWGINALGISDDDKILSTAPFHFDMSTFDIYCSLISGATLVIVPENFLLFPTKILKLIDEKKITIWKAISSLLVYLSKTSSLTTGGLPSLQKILFAGEILPTKHLINWMNHYPDKQYFNAYGPTEATGVSLFYEVTNVPVSPTESIPIGKPCENTEVLLLTENDTPAHQGQRGEICIRGAGLSSGYWNDPEKTAKSFIQNPGSQIPGDRIYRTGDLGKMREDGNIEFSGRKDFQIKYMGYRIEPAEIEMALLGIEGVDEAAVILADSDIIDIPEIVAFFETKNGLEKSQILTHINAVLPPHMIPQYIIPVDKLPHTDRGKVDRKNLQRLFLAHRESKVEKKS